MAPATVCSLTSNLRTLYPSIMTGLPSLRFIEQYDPSNLTSTDQPYAYVCDQVHEVSLSCNVEDVKGNGVGDASWNALAELRDKLAPGTEVGWFVVVNGDTVRAVPGQHLTLDEMEKRMEGERERKSGASSISNIDQVDEQPKPASKGIKGWFSRAKRAKSLKDIRGASKAGGASDPKSPRLSTSTKRSESTSAPKKTATPPSHGDGAGVPNTAKAAGTAAETSKGTAETKNPAVKLEGTKAAEEG